MSIGKISDKEKIQILERFLRAAVGCSDSDALIKYRKISHIYEIIVECDPEIVTRFLDQLDINDIQVDFLSSLRKEEGEVIPIVEVDLMFQPQYWKDVLKLENENKELKKEIKKLRKQLREKENAGRKDRS